jgi:salicylate hydroxylase
VSAALAAYSAARLARATRVQEASRELGRIYHLAGPAGAARNLAMRFAGPRQLLARYDWVYRPSAP